MAVLVVSISFEDLINFSCMWTSDFFLSRQGRMQESDENKLTTFPRRYMLFADFRNRRRFKSRLCIEMVILRDEVGGFCYVC